MPRIDRYVQLGDDKVFGLVLEGFTADLLVLAGQCDSGIPISMASLGHILLNGQRFLNLVADAIHSADGGPAPLEECTDGNR